MIRVAVLGAPGLLRNGLEALLRADTDFEVTAVAEDWESELAGAEVVVSLGESIPDAGAAEGPLPPTVQIRPALSGADLRDAFNSGIRGVLPQDCTGAELTAAIQAAAAGLSVARPADLTDLLLPEPFSARAPAASASVLTPRELEVLRLLADGLANKEISYRLGISEHTVKFHVNSILTRLNASTRAEAVAIGLRRGLILL